MSIKSSLKNKKGFTIIEVVLVLAIAGLIFLMVFLAWPALQRGQKDTQRKEDMARFMTALNSYQSNNNGKIPELNEWDAFRDRYLRSNGDRFSDPDEDEPYPIEARVLSDTADQNDFDKVIHVYTHATCDGESAKGGQNSRKVAILYKLEGGGTRCESN